MAFPVILFDSATGSNSAASGAGPATAKTGSAGVSTGTTVVLDGSPDLSGVATDGSHAIFFNDTTAGNRNFAKITGTANSGTPTAQVTVAETLAVTTKAWAIGGKRLSLSATTSLRLLDNNSAAGDAMPGWSLQFADGYTENVSGVTLRFRRAGDTTDGPITVGGIAGSSNRPVITGTDDAILFRLGDNYQALSDVILLNTNGSKTASYGVFSDGIYDSIRNVKIGASGSGFFRGLAIGGSVYENVEVGFSGAQGIYILDIFSVGLAPYVHDNGTDGLYSDATSLLSVQHGVFARNAGKGINMVDTSGREKFTQCVCDANTSDGYASACTGANGLELIDTIFSNNGGYGANFTGSPAAHLFDAAAFLGNDFYNNTSGATNASPTPFRSSQAVNPQFVNAASGDFTPQNTTLKGTAFPLVVAAATNYQWIGAIQAVIAIALKRFFLIPN